MLGNALCCPSQALFCFDVQNHAIERKMIKILFTYCRRGNHEEITREYFEAKKKYEEIYKSMKNLKKYHKVG